MTGRVFYPATSKTRTAAFVKLWLNVAQSRYPRGPLLTQKATAEIEKKSKSKIDEIDETGVLLTNEKWAYPAHIFIRRTTREYQGALKVFIANGEVNELVNFFRMPANVLIGSFYKNKDHTISRWVSVQPRLTELLDPEWKKTYQAWRAGMKPLPTPSDFEWEIFSRFHLSLPGIRRLFDLITKKRQKRKGRIDIFENNTLKYASFHSTRKRIPTYLIGPPEIVGPDEARYVTSTPIDKIKNANQLHKSWVPYIPESLLPLLGPKPFLKEYKFYKRAVERGIGLGHILKGEPFLLYPPAEYPLVEGSLYFIKITRHDSSGFPSLNIECYSGPRKKNPYLIGSVNLDEDRMLPVRSHVNLMPPPKKSKTYHLCLKS